VPVNPRLPEVSVVIPAYNEERRLQTTILDVSHCIANLDGHPDWEIIIADDGSTDDTAALVRRLHEVDNRVKLLSLPHRGKGSTVRSGILDSRGEIVLFTDADLATPIFEAEKLFATLRSGADVAIGSRAAKGAQRLDEPFYREAMGYVFHFAVQSLLMHQFTDTQCGFKAFRREAAQDIFSRLALYNDESPVLDRAAVTGFDVEVLFLAVYLGYIVEEVPVEWHYRSDSKVSPVRDSFELFRDVLRVRSNARHRVYDSGISSRSIVSTERLPTGLSSVRDDSHVAG
jgi:dolichyl-phosphate beta-glucosyltransferase